MIADVVKFAMERSGCIAGNETVNGGNAEDPGGRGSR